MLKFKASKDQENLYIIYRGFFPFKLKKIGSAFIVPNSSYNISSSENINSRELTRIQKRCRKLANIEGKSVHTEIL